MFCAASYGASFAVAATAVINWGMRPARSTCGSFSISPWIRFASKTLPPGGLTPTIASSTSTESRKRGYADSVRRAPAAAAERDTAPESNSQRQTHPRFPTGPRLYPQAIPDGTRGATFHAHSARDTAIRSKSRTTLSQIAALEPKVAGSPTSVVLASPHPGSRGPSQNVLHESRAERVSGVVGAELR